MSRVFVAPIIGQSAASGAQVIDGSLKFNEDVPTYLKKTFSSTGNRNVWTWSGWVKIDPKGDNQICLFSAYTATNNAGYGMLWFNSDGGTLNFHGWDGGGDAATSDAKFRDNGWYHVVARHDESATPKMKLYVNGELLSLESNLGTSTGISRNIEHRIGYEVYNNRKPYEGSMSQVYFIDGQALGPENFGFTDPLTNTWRPKKYNVPKADTVLVGTPTYASSDFKTTGDKTSDQTGLTFSSWSGSYTGAETKLFKNSTDSAFTLNINLVGGTTDRYLWGSNNLTNWTYIANAGATHYQLSGYKYYATSEGSSSTALQAVAENGPNSFYLPMDGNSPIGQDKSGNGNDWTPVNFGGSVELDKATGALPILNTTQGGTQATVGVRTDAYASNLVLALPLLGNANDESNRINSGSTTKAITVSGSSASTVQSNFYNGSFIFDGSNDYLTFSPGADFAFGTGDFTIECWCYSINRGTYDYIIEGRNSGQTTGTWTLGYGYSGANPSTLEFATGSTTLLTCPTASNPEADRWFHVAITRSGTSLKMFIDGVEVTSATNSTDFSTSPSTSYIGTRYSQQHYWDGYMQDIRVYKGVAKYTSDFVVPATSPDVLPDTPSGVAGGSKLTKITDGAVGGFETTSDYLSVAASSDFEFTGDHTIEFFVYHNTLANDSVPYSTGGSGQPDQIYIGSDGICNYGYSQTGVVSAPAGTIVINKWQHIAVSKSGTNLRMFVDGKIVASSSNHSSTIGSSSNGPRIGARRDGYHPTQGFISNLRVVKGTALYTSEFTPPSAPLTNVTNTKLLCCQSNTQPGAATVAPNVSGVNNGTNWSHFLTTNAGDNFDGSGPKYYAFDGNGSNKAYTGNNSNGTTQGTSFLQVNFPSPISGALRVKCDNGNTVRNVTSGDTLLATQSSGSDNQFVDCGNVSNLSKLRVLMSGGSRPAISVVELDGTTLVDPASPVGNTPATNFNPFITDINTVRGQETGYPTWNPLSGQNIDLQDGNLHAESGTISSYATIPSTMAMTNGKYYAEFTYRENINGAGDGSNFFRFGISQTDRNFESGSDPLGTSKDFGWQGAGTLRARTNGSNSYTYTGNTVADGDILSLAFDADAGKLWIARNGKYATNSSGTGDPVNGNNPDFSSLTYSGGYVFVAGPYAGAASPADGGGRLSASLVANFGQKPFKFPPPDGFQPLNTANTRPETVIARPDQYVGIVTYTGDAPTTQQITGLNFGTNPDFVWVKNYSNATGYHHGLFDTVRGANKIIRSSQNGSEVTTTQQLMSFDHNGFTVGTNSDSQNYVNLDADGYVAWCWRAGGNKNTFNVDDVGYASASDVNMNVGALNGSAYNQSSVWTNDLTGTPYPSQTLSRLFDGTTSTGLIPNNGTSITFSPTGFSSISKLRIYGYSYTGNANGIRVNGNDYTNLFTTGGNYSGSSKWVTIPETHLSSVEWSINSNGLENGHLGGIEVDGKLLVDSGVSVTDVPSIAPTGCSVGTKQGFSIIKYEGNGSSGATLPHGLTQAPDFAIVKNLEETESWGVYHSSQGGTKYAFLNVDNAFDASSALWNNTDPTSSVLTLGNYNGTNKDDIDFIAYLWHDVPGLQKFGTFTANNSTNGPYVELDFRPSIVWVKAASSAGDMSYASWLIADGERSPTNPVNKALFANKYAAEGKRGNGSDNYTGVWLDILSNGFKIRYTGTEVNGVSGQTYIYCAWAEAPTFNLYGGQSNAR